MQMCFASTGFDAMALSKRSSAVITRVSSRTARARYTQSYTVWALANTIAEASPINPRVGDRFDSDGLDIGNQALRFIAAQSQAVSLDCQEEGAADLTDTISLRLARTAVDLLRSRRRDAA